MKNERLILLIGATEECQVILVDVLGDVEAVGLDQLLVLCQLILNTAEKKKEKKMSFLYSLKKERQNNTWTPIKGHYSRD